MRKMLVPTELFDLVTIHVVAMINTINEVIDDMKAEEAKIKEDNAHADDPVQREDADTAEPDIRRGNGQ